MRLTDAVSSYVDRRRSAGSPFVSGEITLRSLCKHCGNLDLDGLTAERIRMFLNGRECSPVTRVSKFSAIKCFVEYYSVRGQMPALLLQKPPKPARTSLPFIYTRTQVRLLLETSDTCQARASQLSGKTFYLILLLLYMTAGTLDEVLTLRWSCVDLTKRQLRLGTSHSRGQRAVPIGNDLRGVLVRHRAASSKVQKEDLVLRSADGRPINRTNLCERFQRLRSLAGLTKNATGRTPRLQDLRYTFAVHRLTSWIEGGESLNELLPALSAYMGYTSLTKAEQFLAYAPGRFRNDLKKLSPATNRKHWRDDAELMTALSRL